MSTDYSYTFLQVTDKINLFTFNFVVILYKTNRLTVFKFSVYSLFSWKETVTTLIGTHFRIISR